MCEVIKPWTSSSRSEAKRLFDYMIANMFLMQATARAKYSPIMFPFMHKFRPKAYMTLAGLPRDWEGWRLHQILARMEEWTLRDEAEARRADHDRADE